MIELLEDVNFTYKPLLLVACEVLLVDDLDGSQRLRFLVQTLPDFAVCA
jgi:hypothetical protein